MGKIVRWQGWIYQLRQKQSIVTHSPHGRHLLETFCTCFFCFVTFQGADKSGKAQTAKDCCQHLYDGTFWGSWRKDDGGEKFTSHYVVFFAFVTLYHSLWLASVLHSLLLLSSHSSSGKVKSFAGHLEKSECCTETGGSCQSSMNNLTKFGQSLISVININIVSIYVYAFVLRSTCN